MATRAPKLTYRQFLAKTPVNPVAGRTGKQRFAAYENAYLSKNKPPRTQVPGNATPTLNSLLARVGQFETPAQLEARANRMANQGITAQQTIIREEAKLMRDEALARMQAQAAAGRAAAQMNSGLFGMVGGEYNAGAREIANLGTGLAGGIAAGTAGDIANANVSLGNVGAPGVSAGGDIGGATQAGVEAYRGGTLPAQAIGTAGEAAQFGLAGMVSAQNLRATQEAQMDLRNAVSTADKARMSALKELAAGRPAQAAQFLQQLQDAQRQQIGLASGLIQQRAAMKQAGFEQGMTRKKFKFDVDQQKLENDLAKKKFGIELSEVDPTKSFAKGWVVNRAGKFILDKNGKKIPWQRLLRGTKTSGSGSGGATLTPGQKVELLEKAQGFVEKSFYGYVRVDEDGNIVPPGKSAKGVKRVPANEAPGFDPNDSRTWGTGAIGYGTALTRLQNMGMDPIEAQNMLDSYYERGDSGRPLFNSYESKVLRKAYGANRFGWLISQITSLHNRGSHAEADALVNKALSGGQGINWPKKWQITTGG